MLPRPPAHKFDVFLSVVGVGQNPSADSKTRLELLRTELTRDFRHVEFLLIDDGSTKGFDVFQDFVARTPNARLIRLSKPHGAEVCVMAGLDVAIGDYVLTLEIDRDPAESATACAQKGVFENRVIIGKSEGFQNYGIFYRLVRAIYFSMTRFIAIDVPEGVTMMAIFPRAVITLMQKSKEKFRYLRLINHSFGIAYEQFPYEQSKIAEQRSLLSAINLGITIAVTQGSRLLRAVSALSLLTAICLVLSITVFHRYFLWPWHVVFGAASLHFLILSVISEYLRAIYNQTRGAELYYVLEDSTSTANPELKNISDMETATHGR